MAFGIDFQKALFFDGVGANNGFICIGTSGTSLNIGSAVIFLSSCNLTYTNNTTELSSFDSSHNVARAITSATWELSCEGFFSTSQENAYSGNSTYVSGQFNGAELLPLAIQKRSDLKVVFGSGGKVVRGAVVISSFELTSSVGEVQVYSMTLSGNGPLTVVA